MAEVNERESAARELLRLRLAYQWAVLHPATGETGVATHGGPALDVPDQRGVAGRGRHPAVAAFTPRPFALDLGMSPRPGRS